MPEINDDLQDSIQQRIESEEVGITDKHESPAVTKENLQQVPQPKIKATRAQQKPKAVAKTSVGDTIARMEDQIKALRFLDSIEAGEVPTPLSKDMRDTLLQFQKDITALKNKYVTQIQKL